MKNNEITTGCTVHYVNKQLDSGKIILQKDFLLKRMITFNPLKTKPSL